LRPLAIGLCFTRTQEADDAGEEMNVDRKAKEAGRRAKAEAKRESEVCPRWESAVQQDAGLLQASLDEAARATPEAGR
jgi:hypothetical protein